MKSNVFTAWLRKILKRDDLTIATENEPNPFKQSTYMAWIVRQQIIERWPLTYTTKRENVSEHCHQVAVIAHLLCVIKNKKFGGNLNSSMAVLIAIFHELSESKHQDFNSASKYYNPEITAAFKKLEDIAERECLNTLPEYLREDFSTLIVQQNVDPVYKTIVKSADILSAYIKTLNELKFGNSEFEHIKEELDLRIARLVEEHEEVAEFMNVFCAAGAANMEVIRGAKI